MLRKLSILLAALLLFLLVSCAAEKAPDSEQREPVDREKYQDLTVQEIPDLAGYIALSSKDKAALMLAMDKIPAADYEALFAEKIAAYCTSDQVPEGVASVELVSVTVEKDDLTLVPGQNKKSLHNLTANIELKLEPVDIYGFDDAASDNFDSLHDYLKNSIFAFSKVQSYEIRTTSEHGFVQSRPCFVSVHDQLVFKEQPASELALQTLAYAFSRKNKDFVMQKFGVLPEEKELYIEYYVSDDYLFAGQGSYAEKVERSREKLPGVYEEFVEAVMTGDEAKTYMEEFGLTTYTVGFRNGSWEAEYQIFHEGYGK